MVAAEPTTATAPARNAAQKRHARKRVPPPTANTGACEAVLGVYCKNMTLATSLARKRHVLAARALDTGDLILQEPALTSAVAADCANEYCSNCWNALGRPGADGKTPQYCPESKLVAYCSEACRDAHKPIHDLELPLLKDELLAQMSDKGFTLKVEYYLMVVRAVIARHLEERRGSDATGDVDAAGAQPPFVRGHYELLRELPVNRQIYCKADREIFQWASRRISALLPPELATSAEELEENMARFTCYQNEITPLNTRETAALRTPAYGIFPLTWLYFRHSCEPNAHMYPTSNGALAVRALRPIAAGEEIQVAFVDLYTGRMDRWVQLATTKCSNLCSTLDKRRQRIGRSCHCARCVEPLATSADRFFQGFLCRKCGADVYLPRDASGAVVEDLLFFKEPAPEAPADAPDAPRPAVDDHVAAYRCIKCDHEIPAAAYTQMEDEVQNDYTLPTRLFQEKSFEFAYRVFQQFVHQYERVQRLLADINPLLFHCRLYIMHAASEARDHATALQAARELLLALDKGGLCPRVSPDRAELFLHMAQFMTSLARGKAGTQTKGEQMYVKRMIRDARVQHASAVEQLRLCYGSHYPAAKLADVPVMPPVSQVSASGGPNGRRRGAAGEHAR